MKTIQTLLLTLLLAAIATGTRAQCSFPFAADTLNGSTRFYCPNAGSHIHWVFGDGDTSDVAGPTHVYAATGTYSVCVTATDSNGCSGTTCQNVTVAPCQTQGGGITASYTYINTQYEVYFTNTSSSPHPPLNSTWTFNNYYNPITTTNTNAAVALPYGNNDVQLTVVDAAGCTTTIDSSIFVMGNKPCFAEFAYQSVGLGVDSFYNDTVPLSDYTYHWTFGDSTSSNLNTPTHTYTQNGYYNVCMTVTSASAGCADTLCEEVFVQACSAHASYVDTLVDSLGETIDFYSTSTTSNPPLTYVWTFDQYDTSTLANPVKQYNGNGYVLVSLTVKDASGCTSTASQYDYVEYGPQGFPSSVWGYVDSGSCPYVVYLIQEDFPGHLVLVDSVFPSDTILPGTSNTTCGNMYQFIIINPGKYYVKAAEQPASPDYADFLPTYFNNDLHWADAQIVYITPNDGLRLDVSLVRGVNPGGPGFIGGYVSQGAGLSANNEGAADAKSLGDHLRGIQVDLTTITGKAVAYTYTDVNGYYKFNNLPYGTYTVFTDVLNDTRPSVNVMLSPSQPGDTTANDSVPGSTLTGIADVNNISINRAYPDPVMSDVQLDVTSGSETSGIIKLIDIIGRTELEKPVRLISGQNHFDINMEDMAGGMYQLVLQTGNKRITYKLVKLK